MHSIEAVPVSFDAIKSTERLRYQYFIWNAVVLPLLLRELAWHRRKPLDVRGDAARRRFGVGEHDFASFARPGHGREHTIRTVYSLDINARLPKIIIGIEGSGFLWQMVRIIVGTLVEVGLGKRSADEMPGILDAKIRTASGSTAPAHGLYLQWIRTRDGTEDSARKVESEESDA